MMANFIPDGWEVKKLGDIATVSTGKTNAQDADSCGLYPLFDRSPIIKRSNKFIFDTEAVIIPGEGKEFIPRFYNGKFDLHQRAYAIFNFNSQVVIAKYVYYFLKYYRAYFSSVAVGSTVKSLRLNHFIDFIINIPPLHTQQQIVSILSSLDNKIELLKEQNKTFENLAQTIFKQWFIDFNFPDENGKPYKDSGGIMVDSELGLIPEAWEVSNLDQIADYTNGLAMQKFRPTLEADVLPVMKIRELRQGFTDLNSDLCKSDIINKVKVNNGDVIFSWSGTLLIGIWCGGECGLNQHLFKVTSSVYPKWFYYLWTKYHLANFISIAETKATTMGHIQRKHLSDAKVYIPKSNILILLDNILNPMLERIVMNCTQSKNLSMLRDSLLPKLMSGEIKI